MDAGNEPGYRVTGESRAPFIPWGQPDQHGSTGLAKRLADSAGTRPFSCASSAIVRNSAPGWFQKGKPGPNFRYSWANTRPMGGIALKNDRSKPGTYLGLLLNLRRRYGVLPAAGRGPIDSKRGPGC